jgi:hypothetical protein
MQPASPTPDTSSIASLLARLQESDPHVRERAAAEIFRQGCALALDAVAAWLDDLPLCDCLRMAGSKHPEMIVGVAVDPGSFERIRAATGMPRLADVPADLDAKEFELEFAHEVRLDVLTTKDPDGPGAIARYLKKSGAGIQQVEIFSKDVDRATEILNTRFGLNPLYPAARAGADGTRVNFFLVPAGPEKKALIEIVEDARRH